MMVLFDNYFNKIFLLSKSGKACVVNLIHVLIFRKEENQIYSAIPGNIYGKELFKSIAHLLEVSSFC